MQVDLDILNSTCDYMLKCSVPFSEYLKDFNIKTFLTLKVSTIYLTFTVFQSLFIEARLGTSTLVETDGVLLHLLMCEPGFQAER